MDDTTREVTGPKFRAVKDDGGEIRVLFRSGKKGWVGYKLVFRYTLSVDNHPARSAERTKFSSRPLAEEFLRLKETRLRHGGPKSLFADRPIQSSEIDRKDAEI